MQRCNKNTASTCSSRLPGTHPDTTPPPQGDECLVQVFKSLNSPRRDKDIPFQTPFKGKVARHCQGHVSIPPRLSSQGERFGSGRIRPAVSLFDLESVGSGMRRMNEECLANSDVCDPLCGSRGR